MPQNILPILEKLISFKSITPKGEDAIKYIAKILSDLNFKCEIKSFGPEESKVTNLYAILGNSSPNICFAGHVDVVPPGDTDLWNSEPFKMMIQDDFIYGRGTVDMKGTIACYLSAVIEFLKSNKPKGSISFLITSDEEGDAKHGTVKMLEHIKDYQPKIDFCILGEPTSKHKIGDTIKIGRRGSMNFTLKITGKQGHVAYPEKAINPIPIITAMLKDLSDKVFDNGTEYFQPSNLEITSIDTGNTVTNVIPESVTAKFNIRFNDTYNASDLSSEVINIIAQHSEAYDLKYSSSSSPFIQKYSARMQEFAQITQEVCQIVPNIETGGGTSDARFIHTYSEIVELGLNCDLAHKINEHTKISDLQALYNVYYSCLVKFL
ncbi:MAG: succinyl-diaminopimelate desuccinylase [Rickettsiaceae bacterium]|nr:succinyl-diaminopimelate desuccinylase [Rickettsiaceae bacterium]